MKKHLLGACLILLAPTNGLFTSEIKQNSTLKTENPRDIFLTALQTHDVMTMRTLLNIAPFNQKLDTEKTYTDLVNKLEQFAAEKLSRNVLSAFYLKTFYGNDNQETLKDITSFVSKTTKKTILHEAVEHGAPSELIMILINFGADPLLSFDNDGLSPIARSIHNNTLEKFLIVFTSDLYKDLPFFSAKIDTQGNTILNLALQKLSLNDKEKLFSFILEKSRLQGGLKIKNSAGISSLDQIYETENLPFIIKLIEMGVRTANKYPRQKANPQLLPKSALNHFIKNNNRPFFDKNNAFPEEPGHKANPCIKFTLLNQQLNKKIIAPKTDQPSFLTNKLLKKIITEKPSILLVNNIPYNQDFSTSTIRSDYPIWPEGSLLHEACYWGWADLIETIINNGGQISLQDSFGNTPLHIAIERGSGKIVSFLLSKKSPLKQNNRKETPLHLAVNLNWTTAIKAILGGLSEQQREREINQVLDINQESVFSKACQNGNIEIIQLLIANGADVNYTTQSTLAPLFHAFNNNQWEVIKLLLKDKQTDPSVKDQAGLNLLNHLCLGGVPSKDLEEIGQHLYKKGALLNTVYAPQNFPIGLLETAPKKCFGKSNYQLAQENGVTPLIKLFNKQFDQQSMQKKSNSTNNGGRINPFKM